MGITTEVFGGDGGEEFDDGYHDRIVEVTINSGNVVDGLTILYNNDDNFVHGGDGGDASTFTLQADEYIDEVTVQAANVIVGLGFKTNLGRTFSPCEGKGMIFQGGKGDTHVIKAPSSQYALKGIKGRQGKFLDAIGLHWGPIITSTDLFGGDGGDEFNDGYHDRIVEITINAGKVVDGISIRYDNDETYDHGGDGGNASTFTLEPNEYITEATVQAADVVVRLGFKTNLGRSFSPCEGDGLFFHGGEGETHVIEAPGSQCALTGLKGRKGKYLDAIGFYWGPAPIA